MAMLHLELRNFKSFEHIDWPLESPQPKVLQDPTPYLLSINSIGK